MPAAAPRSDPPESPIGLKEPTPLELNNAPAKLSIDGRAFRLDVYLWRDFMPTAGGPSNLSDRVPGSKLILIVKLVSVDGRGVPAHVAIEEGWVVKSPKEVWRTSFTQESRPRYPDSIERVGREGPKWGPGIDVDVVSRIRIGDRRWLVRAGKQPIHRTD